MTSDNPFRSPVSKWSLSPYRSDNLSSSWKNWVVLIVSQFHASQYRQIQAY